MLKKNTELAVPTDNPFSVDCLKRKQPVEILTALLQSTKQPFVLSVEAPWGCGKTTFLNLWKAHLEKQGHKCLRLNAWENDFIDDPMVAFLGEIWREVRSAKNTDEGFPLAEAWEKVQSIIGKLTAHALPLAAEIATNSVLQSHTVKNMAKVLSDNAADIGKSAAEVTKSRIAHYQSSQQSIKGAREALAKLAKEMAEATERKQPVVFFIDELDRCRPDFAVALLERVKHLFQVKGFFFVLAIDREQIGHSIRVLYGTGMDVDGYLRRFLDLSFRLPDPPPRAFAEMLYDRFEMDEIFEDAPRGGHGKSALLDWFSRLAVYFKLSLRVQEQCYTELNLVLRTHSPSQDTEIPVLVFLVCFRAHDPHTYKKLIRGEVDPLDFGDSITEPGTAQVGIAPAVAVLAAPIDRSQYYFQHWCEISNAVNRENEKERDRVRRAMEGLNRYRSAFPGGGISLVQRLELLTGFSTK